MMAELFRALVPTILQVADNTRTEVTVKTGPTHVRNNETDKSTTTWATTWTGLAFVYDSEVMLTRHDGASVQTREVLLEAAEQPAVPDETSVIEIAGEKFDVLRVDTDPAVATHIAFIER